MAKSRWRRSDEPSFRLPSNDDNEKSIIEDKSSLDILIILLDTPRQNGLWNIKWVAFQLYWILFDAILIFVVFPVLVLLFH